MTPTILSQEVSYTIIFFKQQLHLFTLFKLQVIDYPIQ